MSELLLLARIAGRRIAFRALDVNSVVEIDTLTPVPGTPSFVSGLAALRSRALTVIDSAKALELEQATTGLEAIVTEHDGHLYALQVEAVEDVAEALSEPQDVRGSVGPGWEHAARGMVESSAGPILLLDAGAIIAGPAHSALRAA
ncbi:MAG: chemotaxis protein CheW [Sphingomonadaceae bacterium]|nr:chemotaxis protein CheW [Sphingomonadaceae bacterium]